MRCSCAKLPKDLDPVPEPAFSFAPCVSFLLPMSSGANCFIWAPQLALEMTPVLACMRGLGSFVNFGRKTS